MRAGLYMAGNGRAGAIVAPASIVPGLDPDIINYGRGPYDNKKPGDLCRVCVFLMFVLCGLFLHIVAVFVPLF